MKDMGQIKKILTETRDWAQEMRDAAGNNRIERAQYTWQVWNLDQAIKITSAIAHVYNRLCNKQR